ncbi:MAG: ABC transporter substrate-binding protein [Nanoarchaeota archaeon]
MTKDYLTAYTPILISLSIAAILLSTGCSSSQTTGAAILDPIVIGWSGSLTGDTAKVGIPNKEGVETAIDEINKNGGVNGRPLQLIAEDDQFDTVKFQTNYNKLVNIKGTKAIISPTYGGLLSIAEQAKKDGVIVIDSLDTSDELANAGDNIFAAGVNDEMIGWTLAEFIPPNETVTIIQDAQEPFMELMTDSFTKRFTGNVSLIEKYDPADHDSRTLALKAKDSGATVVALFGFDETGLIAKQVKTISPGMKIVGVDTFATEGFRENAQGEHEGAYFTNWDLSDSAEAIAFKEAYEKKFGKPLDSPLYAATGHDAMLVVEKALRTGGELKDALYKVKDVKGASGNLTMDADGVVRSIKETMFRYKDGKIMKAERWE